MRCKQLFLHTSKEVPADAQLPSHILMLRASLIQSVGSGLYNWLPIGWRVVQRISQAVRERMDGVGMQEMAMVGVQPADLWKKTGRWQKYGKELLRFSDRHNADFCLGPTHEEVVTQTAKQYVRSRKQLPFCLYQIQTKFRDEVRPRFGVMRAREFIMKDGYSFHHSADDCAVYYQKVHDAYVDTFAHLGLDFRSVVADSGQIGGSQSHEFHVLAEVGEDEIACSDHPDSSYAANIEKVPCVAPKAQAEAQRDIAKVHTPGVSSIKDVSEQLQLAPEKCIKILVVRAHDYTKEKPLLVAIAFCGHHKLNEVKASSHPLVQEPFSFASDEDLKACGMTKGFIGPKNCPLPLLVDYAASVLHNFSCGANEPEYHYINVNWQRDCTEFVVCDMRNACIGDPSPCGNGKIVIQRGIEIGHIFQLGDSYTKKIDFALSDVNGQKFYPVMGCYGIGISRLVAAIIEQNNDERGIVWPMSVAPFVIAIAALNSDKSTAVLKFAESLYQELVSHKVSVLLDDRDLRVGQMLADLELIGIPWIIMVGAKGLDNHVITLKNRANGEQHELGLDNCTHDIMSLVFGC